MARPIDYSKWKDIEVSDDEDDTHPNIDTPSLFKWRHEARVQRTQEFEDKKKTTEQELSKREKEVKELKEKMKKIAPNDPSMEVLKKSLAELEVKREDAAGKIEDVKKEDRLRPWNVDTISKDGFSKTLVNNPPPRPDTSKMTEDEKESYTKEFFKKHEPDLKQFGWLRKYDDSKAFLQEKPVLACEETANYLVIQCINLAMEEKFAAMEQVAHQCIAMQYLVELSKQLNIDPRACIAQFFTKIQVADPEYKKAFNDELEAFKQRIRLRAKEKVKEQMEEIEEEDRQQRLGPGGLDPVDVFESLPKVLQECFESQDVGKLQAAINELPPEEAKHHMKRCVASGLWKPAEDDPNTNPEDGFRRSELGGGGDTNGDDEPTYEEVKDK